MRLGRACLYYFEDFTLRLLSENLKIGCRLGYKSCLLFCMGMKLGLSNGRESIGLEF